MLEIGRIKIPESEIDFQYARSGGPGGQNVNKVNTKAVLFFNVTNSSSIPTTVKERFLIKWKNRINEAGELVLSSERHRSQLQNREDVLEKLKAMIEAVLAPPKNRRKTKPTRGSVERRLKDKKQRSENKTRRSKMDY